jgi:hypothetical protein
MTCWVNHKEFDTVVADLTEMLEDRVAGASRSTWLRKVRRQGFFLPTIGFSDAGINALQDHRPSTVVHPLPVPLLAQGGRLAGRSSVSPQVAAARK